MKCERSERHVVAMGVIDVIDVIDVINVSVFTVLFNDNKIIKKNNKSI
jgi:septum formation inhibitor-activating ATPase MinD